MAIRRQGDYYPDSRNAHSIQDGSDFEVFVLRVLADNFNIHTQRHTTKHDQLLYGDAQIITTGHCIEIKLDNRAYDTKRLSIEVAERTSLTRPWVASGIYASNTATIYIQGDARQFFIFRRADLQAYHTEYAYGKEIDNNPPTIKRFYISQKAAKNIARRIFTATDLPDEYVYLSDYDDEHLALDAAKHEYTYYRPEDNA